MAGSFSGPTMRRRRTRVGYAEQDRVARRRLGVGRRPRVNIVKTSGRLASTQMRVGGLKRFGPLDASGH
jgi:hypothetical protein